MNNFNNFDNNDNNNFMVTGQLMEQNRLKKQELFEQQAMRKAYCKANNVPYEEPEEIPGLSQGSLKVLVFTVWSIIIATVICSLIGEGNFLTNFMKVWF